MAPKNQIRRITTPEIEHGNLLIELTGYVRSVGIDQAFNFGAYNRVSMSMGVRPQGLLDLEHLIVALLKIAPHALFKVLHFYIDPATDRQTASQTNKYQDPDPDPERDRDRNRDRDRAETKTPRASAFVARRMLSVGPAGSVNIHTD